MVAERFEKPLEQINGIDDLVTQPAKINTASLTHNEDYFFWARRLRSRILGRLARRGNHTNMHLLASLSIGTPGLQVKNLGV